MPGTWRADARDAGLARLVTRPKEPNQELRSAPYMVPASTGRSGSEGSLVQSQLRPAQLNGMFSNLRPTLATPGREPPNSLANREEPHQKRCQVCPARQSQRPGRKQRASSGTQRPAPSWESQRRPIRRFMASAARVASDGRCRTPTGTLSASSGRALPGGHFTVFRRHRNRLRPPSAHDCIRFGR